MSDIKWLTYDEAAVALRISPESVRRLAQRRKWSRRPGNDGKVRLGVPAERLEAVALVAGDTAGDDARDTTLNTVTIVTICREHVKMSGLRSTSNVRSGADGLWA